MLCTPQDMNVIQYTESENNIFQKIDKRKSFKEAYVGKTRTF